MVGFDLSAVFAASWTLLAETPSRALKASASDVNLPDSRICGVTKEKDSNSVSRGLLVTKAQPMHD